MKFRVIDGCPCPALIAPYVYLVLRGAKQEASSIYRGEDAKALLHDHGKHTQKEIHRAFPLISNPPGRSQHDLHGEFGQPLEEWQVGVDSGTNTHNSKMAVNNAAKRRGWKIHHPYARGVEGHHWQFVERPRPTSVKQRLRILHLRATLPRR